jgi:hypothetical protein
MKKTLGWGYKLSKESLDKAFYFFGGLDSLHKTKKGALKEIEQAKKYKQIPHGAKPKVFKVIIETQE